VMGQGGWRHFLRLQQVAAGSGTAIAPADLAQNLHPAWLSQRLGYQFHLAWGEFGRHDAKMTPGSGGYKGAGQRW